MTFKNILNKLNIKEDESKKTGLLLTQSIFIGIFLAFYFSFANALFLNTFPISKLPFAYIVSGILGFFSSFLFSLIQKRVNASKVLLYLFLIIAFLLTIFKVSLEIFGDHKYIVFFIFICFAPIATLTSLGFGAISIKFFDLRQGKRLFSVISSGEVISSFIAFISIPLLLGFFANDRDDISFLLYFGIFGLILAFAFQLFIGKQYNFLFNVKSNTTDPVKSKIGFRKIIGNKYYLSIIVLSVVSVLCYMFIDYSFADFSREKYTDKRSLTAFLGLFFGAEKLTEFIFKTFISGRYIEKYGLKFGLGVLPVVLVSITILIVASFIFNFSKSTIFILISLNMGLLVVLRKSFEDPSFNLLFQPLNSATKQSVQTLVSGKAKLFGMILAGGILLAISMFKATTLIISVTLLIFLMFWIFTITKVGENFKSLISNLLKERKGKTHKKISEIHYLHSFEMLRKKENPLIHKHFTHRFIPGFQQVKLLQTNRDNIADLQELINSDHINDHLAALGKLNLNWDENYVNFVCKSALSESMSLRKSAIALLSSKKIDKLHIESYLNSMTNPKWSISLLFLLNIGDNYFETVKKIDLYFQSDTANRISKRLKEISFIQILGENHQKVFDDFFLTKIRDTDSEIETHLLKNLSRRKIVYTSSQKTMFRSKLELEVNYYCWVLASILDLHNQTKFDEIQVLLSNELEVCKNRIYLILGVLYKTNQINEIQSAIEGDESHEVVLAMEMLEEILDADIKEFIIPVYDRIEPKTKYNKLSSLFPQIKMSPIKRLENIINYNFQRSITFLRITAIKKLGQLSHVPNDTILANLFHPNEIIKKAAYTSLFENHNAAYFKYFELENDLDFKKRLTYFNSNQYILSIDKKVELLFQNEFFPHTSKVLLFKIAHLSDMNLTNTLEETCLKKNDFVLFVVSGQIKQTSSSKKPTITKKGGILGLKNSIYSDKTTRLDASENVQYLRITATDLYLILLTEPLLVSSLLNHFPTLRTLKRKKTLKTIDRS
jgi:AAA family ATP:ADP antiporter